MKFCKRLCALGLTNALIYEHSRVSGTMKSRTFVFCLAILLGFSAEGSVTYTYNNPSSGAIPDGSAVGWTAGATVSGAGRYLTGVSVSLDLSGGYNGDLYAYLSYGGVLVPLLNRVGVGSSDPFGYGTAGMSVTLSDGGLQNIHGVATPGGSGTTYKPDGRAISPSSSPSAFDAAGTVTFQNFVSSGVNPNGTWTLFFADLSSGATSSLNSWSLTLGTSEVPEPVNVALMVFAGAVGVVGLARNRKLRSFILRS